LKCGQLFGALNARYILLYSLFGELVVVLLSYFVLGNDIYHPIAGGPSLSGILAFALLPLIATYLVCLPATDVSVMARGHGAKNGDLAEHAAEDSEATGDIVSSTVDAGGDGVEPPGSSRVDIRELPSSFWKFLFMIFFFTAASEMLRCYFIFMRVPTLTYIDSILVLLFRAVFALAILAFALRSSRQVRFGRMYQISLVVVAVVMVLIPFFQTYNMILGSVIGLMTTVMSLLVWCLLALVVFGKRISAVVVFGLGRGALLAGQVCGWVLGIWVLPMLAETDWELAVYVGMAILILVMMILFFSEKRLDRLFEEIVMVRVDLDLLPFNEKTLQAHRPWRVACQRAGEQAMLSPREQEIFELLASGRSPDNIAANMRLSLNTVRTHIRNIYGKFDVHSKSELISRVEEILNDEGGS
jgi:DNA-binding CsgD family transcriptional regulator